MNGMDPVQSLRSAASRIFQAIAEIATLDVPNVKVSGKGRGNMDPNLTLQDRIENSCASLTREAQKLKSYAAALKTAASRHMDTVVDDDKVEERSPPGESRLNRGTHAPPKPKPQEQPKSEIPF